MTKLSELRIGDRFYLGYVKFMVLDETDFVKDNYVESGVWCAVLSDGMQYRTGETWYMLSDLNVEKEDTNGTY